MKRRISETYQLPGNYSNLNFQNIGLGDPTKDKINEALLHDINEAAQYAGITVTVTTAISGHNSLTDAGYPSRHSVGDAVDISIINGKGFSGEQDAKNKGIYDGILKFIENLVSMGYTKNKEMGNKKAVLTFGFSGHDNHIHVSNKTGEYADTDKPLASTGDEDSPPEGYSGDDQSSMKLANKISNMITGPQIQSLVPYMKESLQEEINRIKQLLK